MVLVCIFVISKFIIDIGLFIMESLVLIIKEIYDEIYSIILNL